MLLAPLSQEVWCHYQPTLAWASRRIAYAMQHMVQGGVMVWSDHHHDCPCICCLDSDTGTASTLALFCCKAWRKLNPATPSVSMLSKRGLSLHHLWRILKRSSNAIAVKENQKWHDTLLVRASNLHALCSCRITCVTDILRASHTRLQQSYTEICS